MLLQHFAYLDKDNATLVSEMKPDEYLARHPYGNTWYVTISPEDASMVDMKELEKKFLSILKETEGRVPEHVTYEHHDTEHTHLHMVIPESTKYCHYRLGGGFYQRASRELSEYILENAEEVKSERDDDTEKQGLARIDFEIFRKSTKSEEDEDKRIVELSSFDEADREDVKRRLEFLELSLRQAKQTEEDRYEIGKDMKRTLLNLGKLVHVKEVTSSEDVKDISLDSVDFTTYVAQDDISQVLFETEEKLKIKRLVKKQDGSISYYERMKPKAQGEESAMRKQIEEEKEKALAERAKRAQEAENAKVLERQKNGT